MTPVSIHLARLEDLTALHPVIERAYRGDSARAGWTHEADLIEGDRTTLSTLQEIVTGDHSRLLIGTQGTKTVGCVAIWDCGEGLAHLGQLCVDPLLQAAGIGRQLIAAAEQLAIETFGAARMEMTVIEVRETLIAWYDRRGYKPTGERRDFPIPLDPPLHMTVLQRTLRAR